MSVSFYKKSPRIPASPGADFADFASTRVLVKAGWNMGKFIKVMECDSFPIYRLKAVYAVKNFARKPME